MNLPDLEMQSEHSQLRLENAPEVQQLLLDLLSSQKNGVLATCRESQPYTSLMAYAYTPDLKRLSLATLRKTTKYSNILANPQIALLMDNRQNTSADSSQASALTVLGTAREAGPEEHDFLSFLLLKRHPRLESFLAAPDCALITIQVRRYVLVSNFQQVKVLDVA